MCDLGRNLIRTDAANRVFWFRCWNGWTQIQAADWYGCSPRSWRRWELNERPVPKPLLNRIADYRKRYPNGAKGRRRRLAAI